MVGRMPVAFLHLDVPPDEVDVNVHPTKVEVRFRDSNRIYTHLLSTLRSAFQKSDLHARLQTPREDLPDEETAGAPVRGFAPATGFGGPSAAAAPVRHDRLELTGAPSDRQTVASWFEPSRPQPAAPLGTFGESAHSAARVSPVLPVSDFDEFVVPAVTPGTAVSRPVAEFPAPPPIRPAVPPAPASSILAETRLKAIQVHDSYLIAEAGDGMIVIDQHALHERILYEELRSRVAQGEVESQRLLVPEPVDLSASEAAAVLEQKEVLARLGLEVESFGGDTVLVRSLPAMLPNVVPERLVRDLAEHLRTQPLPPTRDGLLAELLHMVACKAAIKAGQPLTPAEIDALLERRHLVADSHHCPHGRPTALVFTRADLEKQFGRI